jgi:nesprin-1
MRNLN